MLFNQSAIDQWLSHIGEDEANALRGRVAVAQDLEDAFSKDLEFGTGGLRGKLGIGPNRMNEWTVSRATRGLARWLCEREACPSVVIAHDSRHGGEMFASRCASVFADFGIKTHLLGLASTPELSFAVRRLGCSAGVCITASHNPREYNGYKVYGSDGCQITTSCASEVQSYIDQSNLFVRKEHHSSSNVDLIDDIGGQLKEEYLEAVYHELEHADVSSLSVAYTALNGIGGTLVPMLLKRMGIRILHTVSCQINPNGDFPTCPKPNPEVPEAMGAVIALACERGADVALATDPDADRVGAAVRHNGSYRQLSGNEIGELLMDWLLCRAEARHEDISHSVCLTTVVSAPAADEIARLHGVQLRRTLTGFKFIGEQIGLFDSNQEIDRFFFGMEESCGYLRGSYVRDKDGVLALGLLCEMAADYKMRGMTLIDALEQLRRRTGFWADLQISKEYEGAGATQRMKNIMSSIRLLSFKSFGGEKISEFIDFQEKALMPTVNPLPHDLKQTLPATDLLGWQLDNGSRLYIRPSGTEPKLKAYIFARGSSQSMADDLLTAMEHDVFKLLSIDECGAM